MNYCNECAFRKRGLISEARCTQAQVYHPVTQKATIPVSDFPTCSEVRGNTQEECPDFKYPAYSL
jgi:hypothetical protein